MGMGVDGSMATQNSTLHDECAAGHDTMQDGRAESHGISQDERAASRCISNGGHATGCANRPPMDAGHAHVRIRRYDDADLPMMAEIWNEVVRDGIAFPQQDELSESDAIAHFGSQSFCGVAEMRSARAIGCQRANADGGDGGNCISDGTGRCSTCSDGGRCTCDVGNNIGSCSGDGGGLLGLYILHPNNVGRCGHIANASYAVLSSARGMRVGEALVSHSLETARALGFRILQFNAVVSTNLVAIRLYEKLGFVRLGAIPKGFLTKHGVYEDIFPFYREL